MATKPSAGADTVTAEQDVETTLLDVQTVAVKRLIARGKERGYITFDELNAILPPDQNSSEQIEDVMANFSEMGIQVVESEENEEGEIAIAKRIEAGRDMMINGLCESPLTFKAIISWHDQLKAGRMLLRDIVDLEATQGAGEGAGEPAAPGGDGLDAEEPEDDEGEGPGISLSALEEKLKPEVLVTFEEIEGLYKRLHKMQHRRLEPLTSGEEVNTRSEKSYEQLREELVQKVGQ